MDIGANIGYFTALAAAHNAKVYSFEPMKRNYEMIKCTIKSQPYGSFITLFPAGAAGANTTCGIYSDSQNPNDGHVVCDIAKVNAVDPTFKRNYLLRQPIHTLRVSSLGIEAPDVMKIDVEGHEAAAFEGLVDLMDANPDRFKVIFSEFGPWMIHRKGYDPVKYIQLFRSRGYDIYDGGNKFTLSDDEIIAAIKKETIYDLTMIKSEFKQPIKDMSEVVYSLQHEGAQKSTPSLPSTPSGLDFQIPAVKADCSKMVNVEVTRLSGAKTFRMQVEDSGDWIVSSIRSRGHWEPERSTAILTALANVAKEVKRRPVFMDIGANIGYFTALAAAHNAKVYSFEPMK
eukprot:PhF_6_TR37079/c0_g1_i8/m.54341